HKVVTSAFENGVLQGTSVMCERVFLHQPIIVETVLTQAWNYQTNGKAAREGLQRMRDESECRVLAARASTNVSFPNATNMFISMTCSFSTNSMPRTNIVFSSELVTNWSGWDDGPLHASSELYYDHM